MQFVKNFLYNCNPWPKFARAARTANFSVIFLLIAEIYENATSRHIMAIKPIITPIVAESPLPEA